MASSDIRLRWLSIFLSFQIVIASPLACLAASPDSAVSYADLLKLGQCEKTLLGYCHTNLPSEERIQRLEVGIFGQRRNGSYHNRIQAIQAALNSSKGNLLMPPMAAEMDRGASQPTLAQENAKVDASEEATSSGQPDQPVKTLLHQALGQYSAGQYPQAEATFKKVLALDKNNTDAYYNLGAMAESRGDLNSALSYYQSALKIEPSDSDLRKAIEGVESKLTDPSLIPSVSSEMPKPAPSYLDAIKSRNNLKQRINDASSAYKGGDYDKAINILRQVAVVSPNEASVQYALSQCYKAKRQYMDARSALNTALSLDPGNQTYKDALSDLDRQIAHGGRSVATQSYDTMSSGDSANTVASNSPAGQITPFSGVDTNPSTGWQSTGRTGGYSVSGGYLPGFAYRGYGSSSTTRRIERAAIGGITGAAIGAMFGGGGYHSRGRSAMIGGGIGGLFGLLSGW
jgi:tetratricopeptide (TPR) repeat protein